MKISIRRRLTFSFLLTVILSIVTAGLISNYMIDGRFNQYLKQTHENKIQKVVKIAEELYDSSEGFEGIDPFEMKRYAVLEDIYIEIQDADGSIAFSSGQGHLVHKKRMGNMMGHMMGRRMMERIGEYIEEKHPLYHNNSKIGTIHIGYYGDWNLSEGDVGFKNTLNRAFGLSVGIALLFGFIISIILSRQMTTPLVKIIKAANEMKNGNLGIRAEVPTSTLEIEQLANSIDYLAETLQQQEMIRKRLTSDMAHEIRTPLTTLQSHIEAMMDGIWDPTTERFKSCHEEVLRLKKMVDSLQDLAKLEQSGQQVNKSTFDLSLLLDRIVESFQVQAQKKNIRMLSHIAPNFTVHMDPDKLKQIMYNLLSNAYKYSDENSSIEVALTHDKNNIILTVRDEGAGIEVKDLPYIFERFYRGDISRSRETGGAGIGLAIVRGLVEAHNGKITVESVKGKGSCFRIYFPIEMLVSKKES
ncbi:sensor histidine kinase [Geosporobacter ferrireducens]|uniref:histidine kinase n=1 Tax=Geosporobacter ferrireducens TaxID=1424294 RepID=A0A1D8GLB2_9FIRM|nr:HAMP domain-containing sensor histidine kinase [Geosporobacter ferrireducens]AOT71692.1 two-component sensor histidine kinase [Geosporobacter ferrireducens]MTI55466.1 HAMP domain-containing histidine kinase [Geosporobacter ferrireducens]